VGEIAVRTPWQMSGYLGTVDGDTVQATPDGALRSGDLGAFDPDGRLILRGRRKEMIATGGENVFPAEVEAVLSAHPAVKEIAVYGVPDQYWGERVEAAIVPTDGADVTVDQLRSFAAARLAGYKLPKTVRTVPELPLTSNSKIDRKALSRQAAA
jgi:acyl-CoA synthetase (AMP-forming)/AMP-acid ligase II